MPIPLILFDDARGLLDPFRDLRPLMFTRTGALTTLDRYAADPRFHLAALVVPPALAALSRELTTLPVSTPDALLTLSPFTSPSAQPSNQPILLVNARLPIPSLLPSLQPNQCLLEEASGDLIASLVPASSAPAVLAAAFDGKPPSSLTPLPPLPLGSLISRPWHLRTHRDAAIDHDLNILVGRHLPSSAPRAVTTLGEHAVSLHPAASVLPSAVIDTTRGPVVIDAHAVVRPLAVIIGPAYIGPHSTVAEHAVIRPYTAVGPHCKVAGEVSGTIFQAYSNKAHDGYLGDAYVGEWVNLGAATNNSNLLNTYSEIVSRAAPNAPSERTGHQFLGCILGDHTRTAIATRIMTGAVIHTGAMFAASTPLTGPTPRFAWITDDGRRTYRLDKFLDAAQAMMARRSVTPSPAYVDRLRALHLATT